MGRAQLLPGVPRSIHFLKEKTEGYPDRACLRRDYNVLQGEGEGDKGSAVTWSREEVQAGGMA